MDRQTFKRDLLITLLKLNEDNLKQGVYTVSDVEEKTRRIDHHLHDELAELEDIRDIGQTFAESLERTVHELHNNRELYWAWAGKIAATIYLKAEESEKFDLRRSDYQIAFEEFAKECADQFLTDLIQDTLEIKFDRDNSSDRHIDI